MFGLLIITLLVHRVFSNYFYTAAVFEHKRIESSDNSPLTSLIRNLKMYETAAKIAKLKGANIIVFPEYGLVPYGNRSEMKLHSEFVPNPSLEINPCVNLNAYANRPILYSLSCLARKYSIVVVGNMIEAVKCKRKNKCREDGVFLFNTNLVFDRKGKLLLKYHKENMYLEEEIDAATKFQFPVFKTDFGTFSTFICFDINFKRMAEVSKKYDVDAVIYPTKWNEEPPQITSLQVQESWSFANNITLLAANNNLPSEASVGSGIFNGAFDSLVYSYNPDGISKLLVARVPKRGHQLHLPKASITAITEQEHWNFTLDGKDVKRDCSTLLNNQRSIKGFHCDSENVDKYTFIPLTFDSDELFACNNNMCCYLNYASLGLKDRYLLGVYNGTQQSYNSSAWSEESCVLTICDSYKNKPCAIFPRKSQTNFTFISLKANFTSSVIYPSIIESGMRLVPRREWKRENCNGSNINGCIIFSNDAGRAIISFGMRGRPYSRDPKNDIIITSISN